MGVEGSASGAGANISLYAPTPSAGTSNWGAIYGLYGSTVPPRWQHRDRDDESSLDCMRWSRIGDCKALPPKRHPLGPKSLHGLRGVGCHRQWKGHLEHSDVAVVEAVLDIKFLEVRETGTHGDLAQRKVVIQYWAKGGHRPLKGAQSCAHAAVARYLLVVISCQSEAEGLGEILHNSPFEMELGPGLVISVRVFEIVCEPCSCRNLKTDLGIKPRDGSGCVDGGTIEPNAGGVASLPKADWRIV
jgi:hypothetical protein